MVTILGYWFKTIWLPTYFHHDRGLSLSDSAWLLFMALLAGASVWALPETRGVPLVPQPSAVA